jgi:hypothetical protein
VGNLTKQNQAFGGVVDNQSKLATMVETLAKRLDTLNIQQGITHNRALDALQESKQVHTAVEDGFKQMRESSAESLTHIKELIEETKALIRTQSERLAPVDLSKLEKLLGTAAADITQIKEQLAAMPAALVEKEVAL